MKKLVKFIKLVPLLFFGVALIVWTSVFHRSGDRGKQGSADPWSSSDDVVFPY